MMFYNKPYCIIMIFRCTSYLTLLCKIFIGLLISSLSVHTDSGTHSLDPAYLPQNVAVYAGSDVTLSCRATADRSPRIRWVEFVYNKPEGQVISTNEDVSPDHPQASRYTIDNSESNQFDLVISDVRLSDGGRYLCYDLGTAAQAFAELVVIATRQNCTTTVLQGGGVLENIYYTYECMVYFQGNIVPSLMWTGPDTFVQGQYITDNVVWSGAAFTAHRTMTSHHFTSTVQFIESLPPTGDDVASNVPSFTEEFSGDPLAVYWGPQNIYAEPLNPSSEYSIGDVITCGADAYPNPQYQWLNIRTLEVTYSQQFEITSDLLGTIQNMRCQVYNVIYGFIYSTELVIRVVVPELPNYWMYNH